MTSVTSSRLFPLINLDAVKLTLAQIQYSAKSEIFVFLTLAQIQYSAKSEIFVFPETSDKFSRSHVI
ncbi:hypothetical protein B1Q43_21730 [Salmonella enterica]|nr:hypothetical protein [Salmonella enterica]